MSCAYAPAAIRGGHVLAMPSVQLEEVVCMVLSTCSTRTDTTVAAPTLTDALQTDSMLLRGGAQ